VRKSRMQNAGEMKVEIFNGCKASERENIVLKNNKSSHKKRPGSRPLYIS
jgi:hypothetical protein